MKTNENLNLVPREYQKRWQELEEAIGYHDRLYYQLDAPEISDEAYDRLRQELKELALLYPQLDHQESALHRVGYPIFDLTEVQSSSSFEKVSHLFPVTSLDNVTNQETFEKFVEKAYRFLGLPFDESVPWIVEPKIDGLTVILRYEEGILVRAATRGDGAVGEDITANVRTISSIPRHLNSTLCPKLMEVRGEVYMPLSAFQQLNEQRVQEGEAPLANARNAAAGSLRQLDPRITARRTLAFIAHDTTLLHQGEVSSYTQALGLLQQWGLPGPTWSRQISTIKEGMEAFQEIEALRHHLTYEIDGAVCKIDDNRLQRRLGTSSRFPRYALAYKFSASQVATTIEDIKIQVGRTGILTPVAVLRPVTIGGVTVARASLHNQEDVQRKDIRIGDRVLVQRAGDVIPQVIAVMLEHRPIDAQPFVFPKRCPLCESPVVQHAGEVALRCSGGMSCSGQDIWRILHVVTRQALNVEGLGKKHLHHLYARGLVRKPQDLFRLKSEVLAELPGWGTLSAANLIKALDQARKVTMDRWLYSLGMPEIGVVTAKILAEHYETPEKFMEAMAQAYPTLSLLQEEGDGLREGKKILKRVPFFDPPLQEAWKSWENLTSIEGIGDQTGKKCIHFVWENASDMKELLSYLEIVAAEKKPTLENAPTIFEGKKVAFTGSLTSMTRQEAKERVEQLGGKVLSAITGSLDYLILGENPGSKAEKARALKIKVIGEKTFLEEIGE